MTKKSNNWRDFERIDGGKIPNKSSWKKWFKKQPKDSSKVIQGKYYRRPNSSIRNDKVKEEKSRLKKLGYSVRTVKKGKFTTIYRRPNFERKKKRS